MFVSGRDQEDGDEECCVVCVIARLIERERAHAREREHVEECG